ncbi:MAG: OmpH family outer membrane protein [Holosporaceae bacterium]|jgi:Skp family chaperone for outer membrane proteins|nr:OmpH family outer membrane protein [Holosporaceae bacterium]
MKFLRAISFFFSSPRGLNIRTNNYSPLRYRRNNGGRLFALAASFFLFQAECSPAVSIFAALDLKKVASECEAGKDIEKQIEEINQESKKDLKDLETQIKSMESNKKSDYDARKIEDMQMILYDMVRTKKYQISEGYGRAIGVLEKEIKKVVADICKEKGIQIVLNSETIVHMEKNCLDITKETIDRLNKVCKSIKVELKGTK